MIKSKASDPDEYVKVKAKTQISTKNQVVKDQNAEMNQVVMDQNVETNE